MLMILTSFRIALRYCQPGCLSVVSPLGLVNFAKKKKKKKMSKGVFINTLVGGAGQLKIFVVKLF